jgi:hypothetical protein
VTVNLGGHATTDGGTILTIPAGNYWQGSITLSAATFQTGIVRPTVTITGTNCDPVNGTVITSLVLDSALTTGGLVDEAVSVAPFAFYADVAGSGNDAHLVLNFGGATTADASAVGVLQVQ